MRLGGPGNGSAHLPLSQQHLQGFIGSGSQGTVSGGQLLYGNYGSTLTDLDVEKTSTVDDSSKSWLSTTLTKLGL